MNISMRVPSKSILAAAVFFISTAAFADLEWITGSVPKSTPGASGPVVVKDAPPEGNLNPVLGTQDIIVCHMITCTKIVNQYPVDSVNYFYLNKNNQVCYYAYFMLKPSSRIHTASVECFSPSNIRIAKYDQEFRVSFVDRLLTVQNETYQWFLVTQTLGMDHLDTEYGQTGFPRDPGLYTFHLSVDGQLVGITFFYVKEQDNRMTPVPTIPPAPKAGANSLPMATPYTNRPIPGIQQRIPQGIQ